MKDGVGGSEGQTSPAVLWLSSGGWWMWSSRWGIVDVGLSCPVLYWHCALFLCCCYGEGMAMRWQTWALEGGSLAQLQPPQFLINFALDPGSVRASQAGLLVWPDIGESQDREGRASGLFQAAAEQQPTPPTPAGPSMPNSRGSLAAAGCEERTASSSRWARRADRTWHSTTAG